MRIGIDGTIFVSKLSGIGNYGLHLLRDMAAQSPEDEFIVITQQPLCLEFNEPNISIYLDTKSLVSNFYYWKVFGMAGACARASVDVFWAANGVAPFFMPCPVVLTVYDFVYLKAPETMSTPSRWFRRFNQPWWISRSSRLFAISHAVENEMRELYGRSADAVIRPAVSGDFYPRSAEEVSAIRQRYQLGGLYNIIVGTLEPRKNVFPFLMQYFAFCEANPSLVVPPLAIIGGSGWKNDEITRVLEEGESRGLVKRLGYVPFEDLPLLYSGAELFFMPSRYEGFGMPILEARKCGCPVVCSDVAAMREAGAEGALYHPPTAEGMRWALDEVYLHGRVPAADFGEGSDWSWESGATEVLQLLHKAAVKYS